ncbi:MAG: molecular chaperone HtpG [Clostridiales bacterium]|nr:MAG: molecular chaperone HtpG [Clostridiales bacterium]
MAKRQFKAESKRLLDLMINSIYTHREIFLRELVSNASDALDKFYFAQLTGGGSVKREDLCIRIVIDKDARTLTISDNGCGMSKEDMADDLGTIAKSGTLQFRQENSKAADDVDVIGQFGVGFYSAFMVSKKITVTSRAFGAEEAYVWESDGVDGYTIKAADKDANGTDIVLYLKDDTDDEKYGEYLNENKISMLIKRYSDYIRYPIRMDMETRRKKEGADDEYETVVENKILNSMIPVWKKSDEELQENEYNDFYKSKFFDFEDPLAAIHTKVEGSVTYNALLFIPSRPPFDFYSKEYEKGLMLYSNGVMIMEKCKDLLPDYFGFVKGLVDSPDFSLNISREILQHDRQLRLIAKNIEKKVKNELVKMQKDEREKYNRFYDSFGLTLKYGVYQNYGEKKDFLSELLMFRSIGEDKMVTFAEYKEKMPEDQKYIYYACGDSVERIKKLPQTEAVTARGFDVLAMTDDVDEFAIRMLAEFDGREFKSVADKDTGLESEDEKKAVLEKTKDYQDVIDKIKKALDGKVSDVRLSTRLTTHPVCLTSDGDLTLEMEKVLNAMPMDNKVKADRVLEINPNHKVFSALVNAGDEKLEKYAAILYDQALLIEGMAIDDPVAFSNAVCDLMGE